MRIKMLVALLVGAVAAGGGSALAAIANEAKDTKADYTPFEQFTPLAASSPCVGATEIPLQDPFMLPTGYGQQVIAREGDGGSTDLWDMNTQNEFGKDAGRYVYRTHEVGSPPSSQVTVTDLETGVVRLLGWVARSTFAARRPEVRSAFAVCAELASRGVELLNGPMNRDWGLRTASFTDPDGHIWEVAGKIPS